MVTSEKVLYLYRIQIFAAAYDNVFLSVNKVNKAVLVLLSHISGEKPAVLEGLSRRLRISVVAGHNARKIYCGESLVAKQNHG